MDVHLRSEGELRAEERDPQLQVSRARCGLPRARSRGVEMDFQWLTPWEPLSIRSAGSFTDARYRDFANAPAPRSFSSNEQDLSGRTMPFVSKWQFNVTPELRFPLRGRNLPWVG